jgi:hypothetical protein
MMKTLVISATAIALAAPALAQTPQPPPSSTPAQPAAVDFTKADADKSGSLSVAEVKMIDATVTQADFDKADADKSKSLSKAEFDTWAAAKKGDKASAPGQ